MSAQPVDTELYTRASAGLAGEALAELAVPDPDPGDVDEAVEQNTVGASPPGDADATA